MIISGAQGICVAILANTALGSGSADQGGAGSRGYFSRAGETRPIHVRVAREHGLANRAGVGVAQVVPGSPAAMADVRERDVIVAIDDRQPATSTTCGAR